MNSLALTVPTLRYIEYMFFIVITLCHICIPVHSVVEHLSTLYHDVITSLFPGPPKLQCREGTISFGEPLPGVREVIM